MYMEPKQGRCHGDDCPNRWVVFIATAKLTELLREVTGRSEKAPSI